MWEQTTHAVSAIVTLPVRMYDLVRQTVTDEPRDPNGIVGVVGVGRLTGDAVALETTPVLDKAAFVLSLLAGLNLFLFLFNSRTAFICTTAIPVSLLGAVLVLDYFRLSDSEKAGSRLNCA